MLCTAPDREGITVGVPVRAASRPVCGSQSQDQASGVLQCGEQVDLEAVRSGRTAQTPAVRREAAQPGRLRAAFDEPAPDRPVQGVAVNAGQQSADRALGGQDPHGQKRIGVRTDLFQNSPGGVGDPFADRRQ
ncbi:hypothetical protein [Streptomyces sp. NPDC101234]|uniref:hypothetical protein n=1 Tax=Streptomyces sp. NPDC101234 TaxID=3366138 RepID=UPI0037FC4423